MDQAVPPLAGRHGGRAELPAHPAAPGRPHPARGRQLGGDQGKPKGRCWVPTVLPAASRATTTTRSSLVSAGRGGDTKATQGTGWSRPKVATLTGARPASSIRTLATSSRASPDSSSPEPGRHD